MISFKNAKVGDYVKFGNYPQTEKGEIQPIEWQVLSIENNKMLVISRYGLDAKRFDEDSNNWANSEIRRWLNDIFYDKAFTEEEKKYIKSSNLPDVGTSDNVFLLSVKELKKYFANNNERLRSPNPDVSSYVYYVLNDGIFDCYRYVYNDNFLVRPALWINL